MNERDIFEALREADPAAGINPVETARMEARVRARVLHHGAPRLARRRLLLAVAVTVLALATVAASAYLTRQPTQISGIGCAAAIGLDDVYVVEPAGDLDPERCAPLWADGTISNPDIVPAGQVPPLTGCVNDAGTLMVLPTDDPTVCERLGMAVYTPPSNTTRSMVDVKNQLIEQINPQVCPSFDDAKRIAEQALTDAGIDDWTVVVSQPPTEQRPCPSLSFDTTARRILLVPVPHTGS